MGGSGMPHRVARAVGDYGENVACAHLVEAGYEILARNWRCEHGEIDIVARHRGALVVCEVKTRRSDAFGSPVEAVTRPKAARLRRLALCWVRDHGLAAGSLRIDVVAVQLRRSGAPHVEHLRGVA